MLFFCFAVQQLIMKCVSSSGCGVPRRTTTLGAMRTIYQIWLCKTALGEVYFMLHGALIGVMQDQQI